MSLVDSIYDAVADDEAFDALPAILARAVGARSATLQIFADAVPVHVAASYFTPEMTQYYLANQMVKFDPWMNSFNRRFGEVVASDELLSRETFGESVFYNEFFRLFGDDTGVCLGTVLKTRQGLVGVGLHRALRAPAFDDGAVATLDAAIPHLRRLAEARAMMAATGAARDHAGILAGAVSTGVLLVEASGRIRAANATAEAILAAQDGLISRAGVLTAGAQSAASQIERAIAQAAARGDAFGGAILVQRPSARRAYRLVLTPHRDPGAHRSLTLVLIDDPERVDGSLAAKFTALFGLSRSEADLAVLLLHGETIETAAEIRNVHVSTARTQLKSIFSKTETGRQSELLVMLSRVPRFAT